MSSEYTPTVITIITMLGGAVAAFVAEKVVAGSLHKARIAEMRADHDEQCRRYELQIAEYRKRAEDAEAKTERFIEISMRATGVAGDLVALAKKRQEHV